MQVFLENNFIFAPDYLNHKIQFMLRSVVFISSLLCLVYACSNNLSTIGQEVISNNNYIGEESFTLTQISTIKADSFITSSGLYSSDYISRLVIGKYNDEYSGETVAIPAFQVAPSNVLSLPNSAILDSITLQFAYAGNMWGDTLYDVRMQKFHLYQLEELPELDYDNNGYFYNNQPVNLGKLIATTQFYPLTASMAKAYFRIDQEIGEDLFDRMMYRRDKDDDIYDVGGSGSATFYKFLDYFKGLAIVPDEDNNCLMTIHALSDSLYMQFHYSANGVSNTLRFPLSQREYQYNQILNTPIEKFETLTDQEQEVTFEEAEIAFTQGLCGYMTKLTLPTAPLYNKYMTIVKAQLEIKPSYMNNNPVAPPNTINVYTTNELNEFMGILYNNSSSAVTGRLVKNELNTNDTRYIFDMTEYYQNLSAAPPTGKGQQVLLSIPNDGYSSSGISFDQMVILEEPILRVYYAKYK